MSSLLLYARQPFSLLPTAMKSCEELTDLNGRMNFNSCCLPSLFLRRHAKRFPKHKLAPSSNLPESDILIPVSKSALSEQEYLFLQFTTF